MKKRFLSALLAAAMLLTMVPAAFAAEADVLTAQDDAAEFTSDTVQSDNAAIEVHNAGELESAISNGASFIALADSISLTKELEINVSVTIDGRGHTITGQIVLRNGTLKNMTITSETNKLLTIGSGQESNIRMENVTVKYSVTERDPGSAQTISGNKADIVITGGECYSQVFCN